MRYIETPNTPYLLSKKCVQFNIYKVHCHFYSKLHQVFQVCILLSQSLKTKLKVQNYFMWNFRDECWKINIKQTGIL